MAARSRNSRRAQAAPRPLRPNERFAAGDAFVLQRMQDGVPDDAAHGEAAPGDYEWEIQRLDVATRAAR